MDTVAASNPDPEYIHTSLVGEYISYDSIGDGVTYALHIGFLAAISDIGVAACLPPNGLTLSSIGETNATISWNVSDAFEYQYLARPVGASVYTISGTVTANSVSLTSLDPGTEYEFKVLAGCTGAGFSEFSEEFEFSTIGLSECQAPTGLFVSTGTPGSDDQDVTVNWDAVASSGAAFTYKVAHRPLGSTSFTVVDVSSNTSFIIEGLLDGQTYEYQVRTNCTNGSEASSSTLLFETAGTVSCNTPLVFTPGAADISDNAITLSWLPTGSETTFDLRIREQGQFDWIDFSDINAQTLTINSLDGGTTPLPSGTTYEIQVRADCNTSNSDYSVTTFATTTGTSACPVPGNLSLSAATETTASLNWDAVTEAIYYEYRYRAAGTAEWEELVEIIDNSPTITNLTAGTEYEIQVQSICVINNPGSGFSESFEFETAAPAIACEAPTNISVNPSSTNPEATVTWNDTSNPLPIAYEIRYRQQGLSNWTPIVQPSASAFERQLTTLAGGATYELEMRSYCGTSGEIRSDFVAADQFEVFAQNCDIPSNFVATPGSDNNSIDVSWAEGTGEIGFFVRYKPSTSSLWIRNFQSTATAITGLLPGTSYDVEVSRICSEDASVTTDYTESITVTTTGSSTCTTPDPSVTSTGVGSVAIDWADASDDTYTVRYRLKGSTQWIYIDGLGTSEWSSSTLVEGGTYQYQVQSNCAGLNSTFSTLAEFTTEGTVTCDTPALSSTFSATTNSLQISWSSISAAESYEVEYRPDGTVFWNSQSSSTTSLNLAGLVSGTTYEIRVRSICDASNNLFSTFSAISEFATEGEVFCNIPTDFIVNGVSTSTADLGWTGTADLYYQIRYRIKNTTDWSVVATTDATSAVTISNLVAGATYQYEVRSVCATTPMFFASPYSSTNEFTTDGIPCTTPTPTITIDETLPEATITWTAVGPATQYEYRYRVEGSSDWIIATTTSTSITLSGLFQGTNYQFRIRTICGQDVTSDLSDFSVFTTPGTSQCDVPDNLQEANITSNSADLSWTNTGALAYDIQYRSLGSFDWITVGDNASNSLTLLNLSASEDYQWRVRSICSGDRALKSDYSTTGSFQTFSTRNELAENGNEGLDEEEQEAQSTSASDPSKTEALNAQLLEASISLYPNPSSDVLNISFKPTEDGWHQITIYDLAGQAVSTLHEGKLKAGDTWNRKFQTSALKNGLYSLMFSGPKGTRITKKIIIQH